MFGQVVESSERIAAGQFAGLQIDRQGAKLVTNGLGALSGQFICNINKLGAKEGCRLQASHPFQGGAVGAENGQS